MTKGATTASSTIASIGMRSERTSSRRETPPCTPGRLHRCGGQAVLPKRPAGFTSRTMAMITKTTVLEASG